MLEKILKASFCAGLSVIVGCSNPSINLMKNAVSKVENEYKSIHYIPDFRKLTNIELDVAPYRKNLVYRNRKIWEMHSEHYLMGGSYYKSEYVVIIPKVTPKNKHLKFEAYIFIDKKTCEKKVKNIVIGYGNYKNFKVGKDPKRKEFKEKKVNTKELTKINEEVFGYYISWNVKPSDDEQTVIVSLGYPYENKYIHPVVTSSELASLLR